MLSSTNGEHGRNQDTPDYAAALHANNVRQSTNSDDANPFLLAIHDVLAGHEPDHDSNGTVPTALQHLQSTPPQPPVVVNALSSLHTTTGTTNTAPAPPHLLANPITHGAPTMTPDGVTIPSIGGVVTIPSITSDGTVTRKPQIMPRTSHETNNLGITPASQRGLAYAQQVKSLARADFKVKRRRELEAAGETERVTRRRRNDTSLSKRGKYLRRLQKNQDSAAAARSASDAYMNCLEEQAEKFDPEALKLETHLVTVKAQRDNELHMHQQITSYNATLIQAIRNFRDSTSTLTNSNSAGVPDIPSLPDDPEHSLGFVRMPNAG